MKSRMVSIVMAFATLLAGCKGEDAKEGKKGSPRIGYAIHVLNDFTVVVKRGAEDAGKTLGVEVNVQGPPAYDPSAAIAIFNGMVQRKLDGIVTMPMPGELWETPIMQAVESGVPVVTANVTSPGAPSAAWFGQDEFNSGILLAAELKKQLSAAGKTSGKIVVGVCAPGVDVLVKRYDGLKKGLEDSGFAVTEPFNVKVEKAANYAAWEGLAGSNPNTVAMVGLCSMDLPNLAELRKRSNATWIAAGYDLNVETLDAIRAGTVQIAIGQHPYLQGYLPVRALIENAKDDKPLPQGWIDVGTEVVTKENVESIYPRETDKAAETKWYAEHVAKHFADLSKIVKPMPRSK